jgi:hypothetical protein
VLGVSAHVKGVCLKDNLDERLSLKLLASLLLPTES